jgi:hypothetical protein
VCSIHMEAPMCTTDVLIIISTTLFQASAFFPVIHFVELRTKNSVGLLCIRVIEETLTLILSQLSGGAGKTLRDIRSCIILIALIGLGC